ncbi:DUF2490 domain-containing protein [Adhaeribacter soli]|uniref:DUF2490 domain-containing protein n=2 Tax=Adhaeribacter soli TaxID=2607655 RepID=A0A5N1IVD1_9BACT|nr:DUF2490 domain-containing protein [Adhaeribacter soli]
MLLLKMLSVMNKKLVLVLGLWFLNVAFAEAQVKKVKSDPLIWTDLQADFYLKNKGFFFFRNQWRHNTDSDFPGLKESGALSKFYQVYVLAGYEQRFTEKWSGSLFARYTFDTFNDNQIYQAALRHNGKIGETSFIKRLAYDYIRPEFGDSRGRIRPSVALERNFKLGNHTLRPHLSYELFFYQDFKEEDPLIETRTVDRSRLRIAASYKVTPYLWLTPYFTKQTEYYYVLDTFTGEDDDQGNPIIKEKGGKRNRIDPIFGFDIRFIIRGKNTSDETVPQLSSLNDAAGN